MPSIINRYKQLKPLQKLAFSFAIEWIIWFAASLVFYNWFEPQKHTLAEHILYATFMALFPMILLNGKHWEPYLKRRIIAGLKAKQTYNRDPVVCKYYLNPLD